MKSFISESSNAARLLSRCLFVGVSKMDGVLLWTICLGLVWNGSKHKYSWSMLIQQSNSPTSGVFHLTRSLKFQHVSADQVTNSKERQGRRSWCLLDGFETTSSSKVFTRLFQHEPHLPNYPIHIRFRISSHIGLRCSQEQHANLPASAAALTKGQAKVSVFRCFLFFLMASDLIRFINFFHGFSDLLCSSLV